MQRGDRNPELRDLLTRLVAYDTRPDWTVWAREQLGLMWFDANSSATKPILTPHTLIDPTFQDADPTTSDIEDSNRRQVTPAETLPPP